MSMTSREIVRRAIRFEDPERIPMSLPNPYPNDFMHSGVSGDPNGPQKPWHQLENGTWEMVDEWGNVWRRLESISKGEVARGAIESWEHMDRVYWPDYGNPERYERAREAFAAEKSRFRIAGMPGFPFNIARKMRRMENFLADLVLEPDRIRALLKRVEDLLEKMIRNYGRAGADAVMFAEDWGTQDRLLVRPSAWKEFFLPGFERLCAAAKESGVAVFMHSCGYILDIIGPANEAGVDVFQLDQPQLMGVEKLDERFGGRATFWCPVDIQKTLQTRNEEKIVEDAKLMIRRLGGHAGGFIAGYYGSNEALGLDPKWQDIACRTFVKFAQGVPDSE